MTEVDWAFEFRQVDDWPPLAWLAHCRRSSARPAIYHGSGVEIGNGWFCEAVWDGPFEDGGFDLTDIVAGSGGRIRDGDCIFVASGSTVDRLQSLETSDGVLVSNSLACLLSFAGARLVTSHPWYARRLTTIVSGIRRYQPLLPTQCGDVRLTYFDNLRWTGRQLDVTPKPCLRRDFSCFERYYSFLHSSMSAVAANMRSTRRKRRLEFLSTASSGYDSSAVSVLGHQVGCRDVLCIEHETHGGNDSGLPLAAALGMRPLERSSNVWRDMPLAEVPFMAADARGGDVFFVAAAPELGGRVLLTGYHGDKIWDKATHPTPDIVRGDVSGLSLTEYRLMTGTLHCPPTFWGVRQLADIVAISNSPEMAEWDVPGDYSRPICRRIVESAGIPREQFGMQKRAVWVNFRQTQAFLSDSSYRDYLSWLRANRSDWLRRGRLPPIGAARTDGVELAWKAALRNAVESQPGWRSKALSATGVRRAVQFVHAIPTRLRRYTFQWAMSHQVGVYPRPAVRDAAL